MYKIFVADVQVGNAYGSSKYEAIELYKQKHPELDTSENVGKWRAKLFAVRVNKR